MVVFLEIIRIIDCGNGRISAKRKSRRKAAEVPKKRLDMISRKNGPGRPQKVVPSEVVGRADNYRGILALVWDKLWPPLSCAETKDDVLEAIPNAAPYQREDFTANPSLLLAILKDPKFPKLRQPRINFLADSFAGLGKVTPRRSRDICARERANAQGIGQIIRFEFYVECSCGYQGPSRDHACLKCGAPIPQLCFAELGQYLNLQDQNFSSEE